MARLEAGVSGCTAPVVSRGGQLCGRPFRGYDTAGEPRCGFHSRESRRGLRHGVRSTPASGEFQIEPDFVECDLSCTTCGERSTVALPGDKPARETFAALSCPSCGRRGALFFSRSDTNRRTTP